MSGVTTPSGSSRPQRAASGRNPGRYAQDDVGGDDSGEEDEEEDDDDGDGDEDDDYARLQGAVARHRQVAALAAGETYTPDSRSRRVSSSNVNKSRAKDTHKRISQARIEAIENVIVPDTGDTGWMADPASPQEAPHIFAYILQALKTHVSQGRRLAEAIEVLPSDPELLKLDDHPISLSEIELNLSQNQYQSSRDFEMDVLSMFTLFRRVHPQGSQQYGDTIVLQRFYQRLTRGKTNMKHVTLHAIMENHRTANAARNFASVSFGPGEATRGQGTDLTTRPVIRGKTYYTHAYHKGYTFRVGDWIHLMNATDPAKPTVAQVFKICKRDDEKNDPPTLSCCWYYRPEQTVHTASRRFVKEEVFKTGLFADHPVDDVIEKVQVLFYTKWTRGRPGRRDWDPRSPLYFCEARYNEKTYDFNKIKNWNSCLPEELRGSEPAIIPFSEPQGPPNRVESPFLRGIRGSGRLCEEDEVGRGSPQGDIPDPFADRARKKVRVDGGGGSGSNSGHSTPSMQHPSRGGAGGMPPAQLQRGRFVPPGSSGGAGGSTATPPMLSHAQRVVQHMRAALLDKIGRSGVDRLQQLLAGPGARRIDMAGLSASLAGRVDAATLNMWRDAMQTIAGGAAAAAAAGAAGPVPTGSATMTAAASAAAAQGLSTSSGPLQAPTMLTHPSRPPVVERTLVAALQGFDVWSVPLPQETVDLFASGGDADSDKKASAAPTAMTTTRPPSSSPMETTPSTEHKKQTTTTDGEGGTTAQIRWFAGPPMYDVLKRDKPPIHSLAYLAYRARQRGGDDGSGGGVGKGDAEAEAAPSVSADTDNDDAATLALLQEYGLEAAWDHIGKGNGDGADDADDANAVAHESVETQALAQALLSA